MSKTRLTSCLAIAVIAIASMPAFADTPTYIFTVDNMKNQHAQKCLDFPATDATKALQLRTCDFTQDHVYAPHQKWAWIAVGHDANGASDTFAFQNIGNGMCIGVENNSVADAARLVQVPCDFYNPSQLWTRTKKVSYVNYSLTYYEETKWVNYRSKKCMDAWNTFEGVVLQQYKCAGNSTYWWQQEFGATFDPYSH